MTDKPVLNIDDLEFMEFGHGDKFKAQLGEIAIPLGLSRIGCMLHVVPPGKTAFPFHNHHNLDEMFIIIEGEGDYRFGEKKYSVGKGDVIAAPAGGPEVAHQLWNTGDTPLKYFGISDVSDPSVVEYPDSGKFAVSSMMKDGDPRTAHLRFIGRTKDTTGYFDGEE